MMILPLTVSLLVTSAAAPPTYERPDIMVWELENANALPWLPEWTADQLTRLIEKNPHVDVISRAEVKKLLDVETERAALGTATDERLAKIADKVGAELIIFGTTRRLEGKFDVELSIFDAAAAKAVRRARASGKDRKGYGKDLERAASALIGRTLQAPARTLDEAVARLTDKLGNTGATVAPLVVGSTRISSAFGNQVAKHIRAKLKGKAERAITGSFNERADMIEIAIADDGGRRAQTRLLRQVIKTPLVPTNFSLAATEESALSPVKHGNLDVEAWTEQGSYSVVLEEGQEFHFFVRANRDAWVRIVYHLSDGSRALIEQAWKIEANKDVRYPDTFSVAAPYGVERVQFIAFTDKPPRLATTGKAIEGTPYELLGDIDSIVRYRGFIKKKKKDAAEALITLTTTPR